MIKTFALGRVFVSVLEPFSDEALTERALHLESLGIIPGGLDEVRDPADKIRGEPPYIDPNAFYAIKNGHNMAKPEYRTYPDPDEPILFV